MKLTPLKTGFGISILCHAVAFGLVLAVGARLRPPTSQLEETPITLTLIAAPEQPVTPKVSKLVVAQVAVQPARPQPVEPKPVEPASPVEPIKDSVTPEPTAATQPKPSPPAESAKQVVAMAQPTPQTLFHGDSSSITPGKDATSMTGEPGVKAKPNYLKNPEPPYPLLARRRHQEGVVILSVTVTAAGKATKVRLKGSSHFPLLDQAALEAVRGWSFEPGRIGSQAVDSEIEVPVRFQLTQ